MEILTLQQVIALEKGDQISGMAGVISQVMAVKEEIAGRPKQIVKITDGPHEVLVSMELPAECGGVITKDMIGQRLYFWPELNEKGKVSGLRRGQSMPSTYKVGTMTHWINLSHPGKWGVKDGSQTPGMVQPDADEWGEETKAKNPVLPSVEQEQAKVLEQPPEVNAEPAKIVKTSAGEGIPLALALIVLQHRQCVEAALDTAKALHDEFEEVTGGACNEQAIATMAHTIFSEAIKRKTWG